MSERIWGALRKNALYKSTYTLRILRISAHAGVEFIPSSVDASLQYYMIVLILIIMNNNLPVIGCDVITPAVTSCRYTSHHMTASVVLCVCSICVGRCFCDLHLVVTLCVSLAVCLPIGGSVSPAIFFSLRHTIPYWNQPLHRRTPASV